VQTLFDQGTEAIKQRNNKAALENFYRSLQQAPGNEFGERLALLAGEFVVLDALEPRMNEAVKARETSEARREQLLKESKWRGKAGFAAKKAIEDEFRNDPVAIKAWGWRPSDDEKAFRTKLSEGDDAMAKHNAGAASKAYTAAIELAKQAAWRKEARAKLDTARKQLAAATAQTWREGVIADADGDYELALSKYTAVLASDPGNTSAQLRIGRLKRMAGAQ